MLCAVIVTYNRKKLLGENIKMLLEQIIKFDKIFIVDNCSTDGTPEYLNENGWMNSEQFIYIKTESNIGGAGGFYTGTKAAYDAGADWIVLMDDDGRMADDHTMEYLWDVAQKLHHENYGNKKLFVNALVQQENLLSFKMGNKYTVQEAIDAAENGLLVGEANPFNGTMVSRELIEEIGYPNPQFFIKGDEVDFKQRTLDAGGYVVTVVDARYIHPRPETYERAVLGKKVPFFVEAPWKEYYAARNFTYMYKNKRQYKAILFELFFVKMLAVCTMRCKKLKTIRMITRGIVDGWNEHLGINVKP